MKIAEYWHLGAGLGNVGYGLGSNWHVTCFSGYLLQWQQHELLSLGHIHEVLQHVPVCCLEEVTA